MPTVENITRHEDRKRLIRYAVRIDGQTHNLRFSSEPSEDTLTAKVAALQESVAAFQAAVADPRVASVRIRSDGALQIRTADGEEVRVEDVGGIDEAVSGVRTLKAQQPKQPNLQRVLQQFTGRR